jgi:hypothetical protein
LLSYFFSNVFLTFSPDFPRNAFFSISTDFLRTFGGFWQIKPLVFSALGDSGHHPTVGGGHPTGRGDIPQETSEQRGEREEREGSGERVERKPFFNRNPEVCER